MIDHTKFKNTKCLHNNQQTHLLKFKYSILTTENTLRNF